MHCKGGCSALQERLQCTASEMNKTGIEIASPILDKRKGRKDAPVAPRIFLLNPDLSGDLLLADTKSSRSGNESSLTYFRFRSSHTTVRAVRHTAV